METFKKPITNEDGNITNEVGGIADVLAVESFNMLTGTKVVEAELALV